MRKCELSSRAARKAVEEACKIRGKLKQPIRSPMSFLYAQRSTKESRKHARPRHRPIVLMYNGRAPRHHHEATCSISAISAAQKAFSEPE